MNQNPRCVSNVYVNRLVIKTVSARNSNTCTIHLPGTPHEEHKMFSFFMNCSVCELNFLCSLRSLKAIAQTLNNDFVRGFKHPLRKINMTESFIFIRLIVDKRSEIVHYHWYLFEKEKWWWFWKLNSQDYNLYSTLISWLKLNIKNEDLIVFSKEKFLWNICILAIFY